MKTSAGANPCGSDRKRCCWQTITFNLARPPGFVDTICAEPFDPTDVRQIGIQFDTSGSAPSAETAVILVDTVTY